MLRQLPDRRHRNYLRPPGQGGLCSVLRRDKQGTNSGFLGGQSHGQHSGNRPQVPLQAQLSQEGMVPFRCFHKLGRRQKSQKNGQIIQGSRFLHARRSQIHGNPAHWEPKSAALRRRPDPLSGLLHSGIGQSHNFKCGKSIEMKHSAVT